MGESVHKDFAMQTITKIKELFSQTLSKILFSHVVRPSHKDYNCGKAFKKEVSYEVM